MFCLNFRFYLPTEVRFGAGVLKTFHELPMPGSHALVVTTAGRSVRRLGYLDCLLQELKTAGADASVYDRVCPNPTRDNVMEGAALARQDGCDFVVALGGGSAIDAAKAIAAMAVNDGDCWDYVREGTGKALPLKQIPLPLIAIPTTAGTGSEVDAGSVLSYPERREKVSFASPWGYPKVSIVDPELMRSVPPRLTAYQGFDVFAHVVECYLSKAANPASDLIGLDTVRRVVRSLPTAVNQGDNLEARTDMAWASTQAGMCLTLSRLTVMHALEHAMSGVYPELPHGAGLILISRAYLERTARQEACRERMLSLCEAMGVSNAKDPMDLLPAMEELLKACGVADLKMSDFGIRREDLPEIVQKSLEKQRYAMERSPISPEEALEILEQSYA